MGTMTGRGRELAVDCAYRRQSGKGVKQGTLEVDANYFTAELMEKKCSGGKEGVRQTDGHEAGSKKIHPKYSKRICSTG